MADETQLESVAEEAMDSIARDAINEQYHDQEPESYPW